MQRVFLVLMLTIAASCNEYCQINPFDTNCKHKVFSPECGLPHGDEISSADAQLILDMHNMYRSKVALGYELKGSPGPQPPAANMLKMIWDHELAVAAQRYADQCNSGDSCEGCKDVERINVGRNVFVGMSSALTPPGANWNESLQDWYDEVKDFNPENIVNYKFDEDTGSYTQLIWATTYLVGCGYTYFLENDWFKKFYVCYYSPSGNYNGFPIYHPGQHCSGCYSGPICRSNYPGLCA